MDLSPCSDRYVNSLLLLLAEGAPPRTQAVDAFALTLDGAGFEPCRQLRWEGT